MIVPARNEGREQRLRVVIVRQPNGWHWAVEEYNDIREEWRLPYAYEESSRGRTRTLWGARRRSRRALRPPALDARVGREEALVVRRYSMPPLPESEPSPLDAELVAASREGER